MARPQAVRAGTLLAAALPLIAGCAGLSSSPAEPLAEEIPLTPGITVDGTWRQKQAINASARASLAEQQSQELDRRIRELRRQQGELEKLKQEIKDILQSVPRQP